MRFNALLFIILLFFIGCFNAKAITDSEYISSIEQKLFNKQYKTETISSRLNRVEKNIFGVTKKETSVQRIYNIKKALGQLNTSVQKPKTTKPASVKPERKTISSPRLVTSKPKQITTVQYPVINDIESKVLGKTFAQEDIYNRIGRLETTIFNQIFNDALDNRVERLKIAVFGVQNPDIRSGDSENTGGQIASSLDPAASNMILTQLEEQVFKNSYANEPVESRLSRLEMNVFNQTSPDDSANERLERLSAVISAQPSNDLYKDMSTIRQYNNVATQLTVTTIILLLLKGLLF